MTDSHEIFIPLIPENNSCQKSQKIVVGFLTVLAIGFIVELVLICVKYFS